MLRLNIRARQKLLLDFLQKLKRLKQLTDYTLADTHLIHDEHFKGGQKVGIVFNDHPEAEGRRQQDV